jgi:hypothetical protein
VVGACDRSQGKSRLRRLDDVVNDLRELKVKIWRQMQITERNGQITQRRPRF